MNKTVLIALCLLLALAGASAVALWWEGREDEPTIERRHVQLEIIACGPLQICAVAGVPRDYLTGGQVWFMVSDGAEGAVRRAQARLIDGYLAPRARVTFAARLADGTRVHAAGFEYVADGTGPRPQPVEEP